MANMTSMTHQDITGKATLSGQEFSLLEGVSGAAITISSTGGLTLTQSVFSLNTASYFGGAIFSEGILTVSDAGIFSGNTALLAGAVYTSGTTIISQGRFELNTSILTGGAMENVGTLSVTGTDFIKNGSGMGGVLYNDIGGKATFDGCFFSDNTASDGGAFENYAELKITGSTFSGNSAEIGGAIDNCESGNVTLKDVIFDGNSATSVGGAIYNDSSATISLTDVSFLTATDTIINYGTMLLQGTISLAGTLTTDSAIDATGVSLAFDIRSYAAGNATAIVGNLAQLTGVADYSLAVTENQAAGTYALAGSAAGFDSGIALQCGDFESLALSADNTVTYHNSVYTLGTAGGTLAATVANYATEASASALAWADINGAESYALELSCGEEQLALEISTRGVELLGLANGNYTWQVRNTAEADNWQTGEAFEQTEAAEGPQELVASGEAPTALFFAKADGIWGSGYAARNMLTGETVQLAGKAQITDVFTGADNASILMLDAFASTSCPVPEVQASGKTSGVALFLDDIYSAAQGSAQRTRLANIGTIIASDGDDIIDLTSDRYALAGNVTILGGDGDDIIWANSGNDVLSGGAGNDTLHGGGGNDIFCFGEGWGQDTIGQLAGAENSVTLWFSQSSETLNLTFTTQGSDTLITASTGDSIRAIGMSVTIDDCRFGATGHESEYTTLASAGVFA